MAENIGVNKVFLLGEIITEPRCHTYSQYRREYHFTLVTKEIFDRKDNQEHLEYHHIRLPEGIGLKEQLKLIKGQFLHVEGKIRTTCPNIGEPIKQYRTEVVAFKVTAIG